jgi:hypothetical protein
MPGITEQCCQSLGLKEVRRGNVQRDVINADEEFFDPSFSTALSLVAYAARRDVLGAGEKSETASKSPILKLFNKLKNSEIFGG